MFVFAKELTSFPEIPKSHSLIFPLLLMRILAEASHLQRRTTMIRFTRKVMLPLCMTSGNEELV